jgi:hypothetical protein
MDRSNVVKMNSWLERGSLILNPKLSRTFILLLCLFAAVPMWAQVDTGLIGGTLHDQAGAVISFGKVTITNQSTRISTAATVDPQGNFISAPLQPGTYSVGVVVPGFESQTRTDVTLQVQDRLSLDFRLAVGQVNQNIVVKDETPAIQTETSSLGEVISAETMTDLPLNGRNYVQLASLTVGVVNTSVGQNGNSIGGPNAFVSNGSRGDLNNFLLDGIDNNDNAFGTILVSSNVDALQEFKIQTNSYSAEFGRSGGAAINAVTKSGTNSYHGDVFEFFRNAALDARNYFEDPASKKASFKQNQFGGVLGGPIMRNKFFWFGDYQGTSIHNPETFISTVPTMDERSGDFSAAGLPTIYDPSTYDPITNTRTAFPLNKITHGIDTIAQNYVDLYPLPNYPSPSQPGLANNFLITPNLTDSLSQGDLRLDYHPSDVDQLFFRWSMSGETILKPPPLTGQGNGGSSSTGLDSYKIMGAALGETHTFTQHIVNEFRTGFNWKGVSIGIPVGGAVTPPTNLMIPGITYIPGLVGLAVFVPSGYHRIGDPQFAPTISGTEERQIDDTLNWIRGKHTIALGGQMRWSEFNIFQLPAQNGVFNFSGQFTQDPSSGDGGNALADMLLGLPIFATYDTVVKIRNRQHVPAVFIQDDYKVSKTLTLNLGLRYDYFSPIVSANDEQSNFDYQTGQLIVAGQNGNSRGLTTVDHKNFSPRVGFAKKISSRSVLSGAYGIFFSGQEIKTAATLQLGYNLPFYYEPIDQSDGITPVVTISGGFPPFSLSNAPFPAVTSLDSRLKTPYYQQWNLSIQQALPFTTSLEVSYAGSGGTHLQVLTDNNQVMVPGPGAIQPRRPWPNFGPFESMSDIGSSTYHSLQVKVEKKESHGLYFLSSFTFSKMIDNLPEICCQQPWAQNNWDLRAEKGLSDTNQTYRWVLTSDYALPFGKGRTFLSKGRAINLIAGGWHFNEIYTLDSGFPFSAQIGYDPSNTGDQGMTRPDRIANGNFPRSQRNPNNWFDVNAFPLPAPYTFGNAGRNILIGPDQNDLDASLRKLFQIREAQSLELRIESFNVLNHPSFAQPDPFITDGPGQTGVVTSTALANREVQIAMKYRF